MRGVGADPYLNPVYGVLSSFRVIRRFGSDDTSIRDNGATGQGGGPGSTNSGCGGSPPLSNKRRRDKLAESREYPHTLYCMNEAVNVVVYTATLKVKLM